MLVVSLVLPLGSAICPTMASRTVAPSPRRMRRAWEAGLRPGARWMEAGLACVALGVGLEWMGPALARGWDSVFRSSLAGAPSVAAFLTPWGAIVVVAAATSLAAGIALRTFGPVRSALDRSMPPRLGGPGTAMVGLAVVASVGLLLVCGPALAGAARGADATGSSLAALWGHWAIRLMISGGLLLILVGVAEHVLMRKRLWRDLHLTPEQARAQARRDGGAGG